MNKELSKAALEIAVSQVGQKESPEGSNSGPMVDKYLASVGLKPGYAWCQSFVHFCYGEAAKVQEVANPVPKTGGVLSCWNTAKGTKLQKHQIQNNTEILPGAQIFFDHGKGTGHTGIVESYSNGIFHTIEGNTNDGGSREGIAVLRKQRTLTDPHLLGVVMY